MLVGSFSPVHRGTLGDVRSLRPVLSLPLLALALAPMSAHAAATKSVAIPCYNVDGQTWDYLVKPKLCVAYDPYTQEVVPISLEALKWTKWGSKTATAKGKVKGEDYSGPIEVKASGLKRCSAKLSIYTRYRADIPKKGSFVVQADLPCPKA